MARQLDLLSRGLTEADPKAEVSRFVTAQMERWRAAHAELEAMRRAEQPPGEHIDWPPGFWDFMRWERVGERFERTFHFAWHQAVACQRDVGIFVHAGGGGKHVWSVFSTLVMPRSSDSPREHPPLVLLLDSAMRMKPVCCEQQSINIAFQRKRLRAKT